MGVILLIARNWLKDSPKGSVARSWLAVSLVTGLILICVIAFAVDDTAMRSTLIGALAANAGAVVAYYFSTKSSEQAQKDLMAVTLGTETVPDLVGSTRAQAEALMPAIPLTLKGSCCQQERHKG